MSSRIISLTAAVCCMASSLFSQQSYNLAGNVTDSASGEPLVAVNIRLVGTSRGTITNGKGEYKFFLKSGEYTLIFSSLAYQPETLRVSVDGNLLRNIKLVQSPIQVPEVLVLAEDPAIEIVRKAIANKRKWMDKLKSYRFEAFTRQVLRRDTSIASITEAYTTGYMLAGDTLREVVKQKRQTENIPIDENFAAVGRIVNFNEDEVWLFRFTVDGNSSSYTFVGPTAPEALDYYDYKLLNTTTVNGVEVYKIKMTPKTRLKPLFEGVITIADETFAVMGVDVKPNETLNIPFVKDIDLRYRQQFSLYNDEFWMPTDMRIIGSFHVGVIGFSLPVIGMDRTSSIYDYAVNVPIPDSVLHQPRLRVDSSSTVFDSTFWKQNDVLPLTSDEQSAYQSLDSTQTLEKQFKPRGPLASLNDDQTDNILGAIDVRFNRVEGFFFGGKFESDSIARNSTIRAAAGIGFADKMFKYNFGGTVFLSKERQIGIGADIYRKLDHVDDGNYYGPLSISLMSLIDKNDYRDYFLSTGWRWFLTARPSRSVSATVSLINERQYSMENVTDYSLFGKSGAYRYNPPIADGNLRSLRFDLRLGQAATPLGIVSRNAFELSAEHSSSFLASSEFDFTRFNAMLSWNVRTFSRSLLFSPVLRIMLSAGTSIGTLPPQHAFVLDSRASGYAPFGVLRGSNVKEFSGNRFVMLNLEHNFRSVPFLAMNIPFLYRNGIELVTHGSFAQTWFDNISTSNGWYAEAGIGINRILDIFRADLTYRFSDPRRLYFSLSVANLF